eukprot:gene5724-5964_t
MTTADAKFCIEEFDTVTQKLRELVAIRTEYIATVDEGAKGVSCMHGDDECAGNTQQLCLQEHTPPEKTMALFFPSLVCHMAASPGSDIKPLKQCMTLSSVPDSIQQKVAACASGAEGTKLAIQSAKVVEERQVVKSCTVFIAGQKRCIRDGGTCAQGGPAVHQLPSGKKVPIELYVMSQCPDARFCQRAFSDIISNVSSLVTLRTEYIAKATQDKKQKVLECNSGPQGTQLQLASAAKVAKNEVVKSCTVFIGGKQRCIRDGGSWQTPEEGLQRS